MTLASTPLVAGVMPGPEDLRRSGIRVLAGKEKEPASHLKETLEKLATVGHEKEEQGESARKESTLALVQMGCGLPALTKKLLDKIEAGNYIDLAKLPPVKGKGKTVSQAFDGQIVVVQATDLVQTRRLIPDLTTGIQCFGLLTTAVTHRTPD